MKLHEIYQELDEFKRLRSKALRLAKTEPSDLFITALAFDDCGTPVPDAMAEEVLQNERRRTDTRLCNLSQKYGIDASELSAPDF